MTKAEISKHIFRRLDEFSDWILENEYNMKCAGTTDFAEMKTENYMLKMFRKELTRINNMVNDIEEAE